MTRDTTAVRFARLETMIDNMQKALGSQVTIVQELRASHNRSIQALSDAFHRQDVSDIAALLASLDHDPDRPD